MFPGEFGEPVETGGETVRLLVTAGSGAPSVPPGGAPAGPPPWGAPWAGPPPAGSVAKAVTRSPNRSAKRRRSRRPGCGPCAARRPGGARRGSRPRGGAAYQAYVVRQYGPGPGYLAGVGAQGVDLEVMAGEPAHEPFAPRVRLTGRIRIATLGEQSNAHECTPSSPVDVLVCRRHGRHLQEEAMQRGRWCDGRLSIAPPEGVKAGDFPPQRAFLRAMCGTGRATGRRYRWVGNGQELGRQVTPSVVRNLVCCIITGASAPCREQLSWLRPSRWPTSWLISICR